MISEYFANLVRSWNAFWFEPRSVHTLAVMRILVGSMLFYTHAVWTLELETFFGFSSSVIPTEYRFAFPNISQFAWSHFDWIDSDIWMWGTHVVALIVFAMFTVGLFTRATSILSFLLVVSYANRASGALFGLDQINAFLTMYLAISHCGSKFSMDQWLLNSKSNSGPMPEQGRGVVSTANTIATRLIQIHLCIVYLFAGLGKLQGSTWWNGLGIWGTIASHEYQTLDLTWMADYLWLVNLVTYLAVAWEVSYPFLIWPKLTRPVFLTIAVAIHLGIGVSMGMMTFGLIMLYANLAFVSPTWTARILRTNR